MWLRSLYYLKKAFDTLNYNSEEISNFQNRQLQSVIDACNSMPYYEDRWPENAVVQSKEDLKKLPLTDASSFRSQQRNMDQLIQDTGVSRQTSGTSGSSIRVRFAEQAHDWLSAVYARTLLLQGYRPRQVIAQYWQEPEDNRSWLGEKLMPTQYIAPNSSLNQQIAHLVEHDPDVLRYFPQMLLAICKKMNREGQVDIDPGLILTYGELLTPSMREYIESTFDAPIFDQYATTEFGIVAWECPEGGYHVAEDSVFAEIVDSEDNKIPSGESGKMVLTGLVNTDTALARYEIGDVVELADDSCSHKTSFKHINRIRGRKENIFFNTEGEPVFPDQVIDIIAPVEEILFFQVVAADEKYQIKYVPNTDFKEGVLKSAVREIRSELSLEPLELVEVEDIPQSDGGKIRIIENNQSQSDESSKIF